MISSRVSTCRGLRIVNTLEQRVLRPRQRERAPTLGRPPGSADRARAPLQARAAHVLVRPDASAAAGRAPARATPRARTASPGSRPRRGPALRIVSSSGVARRQDQDRRPVPGRRADRRRDLEAVGGVRHQHVEHHRVELRLPEAWPSAPPGRSSAVVTRVALQLEAPSRRPRRRPDRRPRPAPAAEPRPNPSVPCTSGLSTPRDHRPHE